MNIKINISSLILFLGCITLFYFLGRGKYHRDIDSAQIALYDAQKRIYDDSISYTKTIDGLQRYVNEKEAKVVSTQKELKEVSSEAERLKKLRVRDVQSISDLRLKIDSMSGKLNTHGNVVIHDTIENELVGYIQMPVRGSFVDEWTRLSVEITDTSSFFNMSLTLPLTATIGTKGIVKPKTYSFVDTPVPYVTIDKNNVVVVHEKHWYDRKLLWLFGGVATGILLF